MKSDVTHINVGYFIIIMPGLTSKNGCVRLRKSTLFLWRLLPLLARRTKGEKKRRAYSILTPKML
jgi:hypothetical protein